MSYQEQPTTTTTLLDKEPPTSTVAVVAFGLGRPLERRRGGGTDEGSRVIIGDSVARTRYRSVGPDRTGAG